jgi:hypothetical protein
MSPVVLRIGRYRFSFYGGDAAERAHVHVFGGDGTAKFWLRPDVALAVRAGYDDREIREIERLVNDNRGYLLERWDGFFGRG